MIFRTRATTSCELMPAGLSMISAPFIKSILDCRLAIVAVSAVSHVVKYQIIYHSGHRGKQKRGDEEKQPLDPAKSRERVFQRAGKLLAAKTRSVAELRERLLE